MKIGAFMTTSDLYHMQGTYLYEQVGGTTYVGNAVVFKIEPRKPAICCPRCKSRNVKTVRKYRRILKGVPTGNRKRVLLDTLIPVVKCLDCERTGAIDTGFSKPKKTHTKAFAKNALALATQMSVDAVAKYLNVSWHMINDILVDYLDGKYSKKKFKHLRRIAIDETAIGRGHRYITVVMDLDTKEPIFVGGGKSESALEPFWEVLGRRKRKIEAVAMDMGGAYQNAVRNNIPNARIVFDRFHVMRLMNRKLESLRHKEFHDAANANRDVIKGSKYLLLKNDENLDPKRNEKERLEKVLAMNKNLNTAYVLKESMRLFWTFDTREKAESNVRSWIRQAGASGIGILTNLAKTIERHIEGILNYYDHDKMTSAAIESLNNGIKVLNRKAYGFRDMRKFILIILGIREFNPKKLFSSA
jgi:transposase